MRPRVVGIVGGMGPQATVDLYQEIIRLTPARTDQDHIRVVIYSNPQIPDRTRAILERGEDPLPLLIETAKTLEAAGAGLLAIPCNTAHFFLPELARRVRIPILDMIRETLAAVVQRRPGIRKAGLLAATGTVRSGIYSRAFAERRVEIVAPDDGDQERVHDAISQVKAGDHDAGTRATFHAIGARLVASGAESVILGCTEIPLAFDERAVPYPSINATRVLAAAALDWALGKRD